MDDLSHDDHSPDQHDADLLPENANHSADENDSWSLTNPAGTAPQGANDRSKQQPVQSNQARHGDGQDLYCDFLGAVKVKDGLFIGD